MFSFSLFSPFSATSLAAIAPFCAPLNHFDQLLRLNCVFKFICTFQLWLNPFEIERFHQNLLLLGLHQVEQQRSEIGFETQTLSILLVFRRKHTTHLALKQPLYQHSSFSIYLNCFFVLLKKGFYFRTILN